MTLAQARAHSAGVLADRRLKPALRRKVEAVIEDLGGKGEGCVFLAFEGYRSPVRQIKLWMLGTSKVRHGRHCLGRAVDIVAFDVLRGEWSWSARWPWWLVGKSAEAHSLEWGGHWRTIYDPYHVQL